MLLTQTFQTVGEGLQIWTCTVSGRGHVTVASLSTFSKSGPFRYYVDGMVIKSMIKRYSGKTRISMLIMFNICLLSIYYVPGTVLDSGDTIVK